MERSVPEPCTSSEFRRAANTLSKQPPARPQTPQPNAGASRLTTFDLTHLVLNSPATFPARPTELRSPIAVAFAIILLVRTLMFCRTRWSASFPVLSFRAVLLRERLPMIAHDPFDDGHDLRERMHLADAQSFERFNRCPITPPAAVRVLGAACGFPAASWGLRTSSWPSRPSAASRGFWGLLVAFFAAFFPVYASSCCHSELLAGAAAYGCAPRRTLVADDTRPTTTALASESVTIAAGRCNLLEVAEADGGIPKAVMESQRAFPLGAPPRFTNPKECSPVHGRV